MYVSLWLKKEHINLPQTWHAYALKPGKDFRNVSVLGSSPSEGGSCSLETRHDRTRVPRPKLFILMRRLKEQRPQPRKTVLGWVPVKMVPVTWKQAWLKSGTKTKDVCFKEEIARTKDTTPKNCPGIECQWGWLLQLGKTKHDRTAPRPKWFVPAGRFLFKHILLSSSILIVNFINELLCGYLIIFFSQFVAVQCISEFNKFTLQRIWEGRTDPTAIYNHTEKMGRTLNISQTN
jgi:hypothetical protein